MSAPSAAARESSQVGRESTHASADAWADVQDPNERRRIQNRLAQRRFRQSRRARAALDARTDNDTGEKAREQREDAEREAENLLRAGSAYASPEPGDLDPGHELEGLPWGGPSLRHIVESGKSKEQASQRSSREPSVLAAAAAAAAASQAGWSAR